MIEKSHTVTPYGGSNPVTIGGYTTAPVYITEWNRHTPVNPSSSRASQELATSNFIRTAFDRIRRWNTNREVFDNVSGVYRSYDHRGLQHNFHPIKGACYFVFSDEGLWYDYSLNYWHWLSGSATGSADMYNVYQSEIGRRDPGGR